MLVGYWLWVVVGLFVVLLGVIVIGYMSILGYFGFVELVLNVFLLIGLVVSLVM